MHLAHLPSKLRDMERNAGEDCWPVESLALLADVGVWGNVVPKRFGGAQASAVKRLETYELVAQGSLSLALILTQHDAACELLTDCDNETLAARILKPCAAGDRLLTVGISQLTTSQQHGKGPAMRALVSGDGFTLNGTMPWVTSGRRADHIVTGAVLDNEQQILACVPTDAPGLDISEPLDLLALKSSWTSRVQCNDVRLSREWLMRGPVPQALARRAPVKGLTVSAVGVGVAGALLAMGRELAASLPEAADLWDQAIEPHYHEVRNNLFNAAAGLKPKKPAQTQPAAVSPHANRSAQLTSYDRPATPSADRVHEDEEKTVPAADIRAAVNDLVGRLAITLMTAAKGTGYLSSHPAQRLVREALFFFVWSAPADVRLGTLTRLWRNEWPRM
jgi:alkylation response protein AidB-like acyl-CoA dehydrogenase